MNYIDKLLAALEVSVKDSLGGAKVGVLFSGGIDSCVIAELARRGADVTTYTMGVKGSHDMKVGESTARRLGIDWVGTEVDDDDIRDAVVGIREVLGDIGPLAISFEMPLYVVAGVAGERVLTSGQGADEMFGGYSRYGKMDPSMRREEMRKDIASLIESGSPMERKLASHFGKVMVHPFLDTRVIEVALSLPSELIINGEERKVALREVARSLNLIEEAERKKKAAQYGSGVMRSMKAMAKKDGMSLREWVSSVGPSGR